MMIRFWLFLGSGSFHSGQDSIEFDVYNVNIHVIVC